MNFNPASMLAQVPEPSVLGTYIIENGFTFFTSFIVIIILTFVLLMFAMHARLGIVYLILSMYIGYAMLVAFPFTTFITTFIDIPIYKALASLALFVVFTLIPYRFIDRLAGGGVGILTFFTNLILAFFAAAFIMAIGYHILGFAGLLPNTPATALFAPDSYFFYWFIAPLLVAYILVH